MLQKYGFYCAKIEQLITRIIYQTRAKRQPFDKNCTTILAYHEICDFPREISRLHSYNVAPAAFNQQMEFLYRNNYSVIKLERLISCLTEKVALPQRSVVITFDDGYKNNYTNALPVLENHKFPATIFLATDYIGSNQIFPWLNGLDVNDPYLRDNWRPLSWQEVAEMSHNAVTFGSHTCSHSNIRLMREKDFEEEIEQSKQAIEERINRRVKLFSYPFSYPRFRQRYRELIKNTTAALIRTGFSGACTTIIGPNSLESDPFCLKRIQIRSIDSLSHFKAKIEGAYNWAGQAQKVYQRYLEPVFDRGSP